MLNDHLVSQVTALCEEAGQAILQVYHGHESLQAQRKLDDSPVTAADYAAHRILCAGLERLSPSCPILSEEAEPAPFAERRNWSRYWLVDPLDGTREFLHKNGEFTVNVALIEDGRSAFGVVHVPATGVTYWGQPGVGAYKRVQGQRQALHTRPLAERLAQGLPLTVLGSRRHGQEQLEQLLSHLREQLGKLESLNLGSSLKFCYIAEGLADFYPRLSPTCEWDTAAAQAVVEGAGGQVVGANFVPLAYNQKADLLNPNFFVCGDPNYPWPAVLITNR